VATDYSPVVVDAIAVDVLGPIRITVSGRPIELRGRTLLVLLRLLIANGAPVTAQGLRRDVWGPESSDGAVRVTLTRIRKSLGDEVIERRDRGYVLASAKSDAWRFDDLVERARDRASALEHRIDAYDEALAQWRGDAYDGVGRRSWVEIEAARLEELRLQAADERWELCSLVDDPARLVADLSVAFEEEPLRERRAELLALALYRSNRHAEAVAVLQRCADRVRESLGLEPSPSLGELEYQILMHDPDLLITPLDLRATATAEIESQLRTAISLVRAEAYVEAIDVLDRAASRSREVGDHGTYADTLLVRAVHHTMSGLGDPRPLIDEARAIARRLRDGPRLARCAVTSLGGGLSTDANEGLVELLEPLELLPRTAPERVDLLCAAAVMVALTSGSTGGRRLIDAATELDDDQGTPRSGAVLAAARCIAGAVSGEPPDHLEELALDSLRFAQQTDDPVVAVVATHALLRARYARGDLDGVDELLEPLLRAGRTALLPFAIARVSLCRTSHALARGDLDQVDRLIEETTRLQHRLSTLNTHRALLAQRALLLRELGRLDELVDDLRSLAVPGNDYWLVFSALLALADDTAPSPASLLDRVGDDASTMPFAALAVDVADERNDPNLASWSLSRLDEPQNSLIASGIGTVLFGFDSYFAGRARRVVGQLDAAVAALEDAIRASERNAADLWLDHSRIELARTLGQRRAAGDLRRARTLANTVRQRSVIHQSDRLAALTARVLSTTTAG
jgi:DNA-binding SARP family transcriptional activator